MRISKQSSGGRGEYEIAENAPNGLRPADLLNHEVQLRLGASLIRTGVQLLRQGGKLRLRRIGNQKAYPQVPTQIANVLLLPDPARDERTMTGGQPVLLSDRYIIQDINFGAVNRTTAPAFVAEVRSLDCKNQAFQAERIDVQRRMADVERLWRNRDKFPPDVASLLGQHQKVVESKGPILNAAGQLVSNLQAKMQEYAADLGVVYSPRTDVVPALIAALNEIIEEQPASLDQIEPEQLELRRREIQRWQQYASRRGAESVRFKREVRAAYDFRCIICGVRFPPTVVNANPGIDAAHILPWAAYDLDKCCNGLALCKTHHWAFDEHLLTIVYREGKYFVEFSEEAEANLSAPEFSVDALRAFVGEVPEERLPVDPADRPRPEILQRLNEETA